MPLLQAFSLWKINDPRKQLVLGGGGVPELIPEVEAGARPLWSQAGEMKEGMTALFGEACL